MFYAQPMYLLTQAIRSRFRKYALFSQLHREHPRVLLQLSTRHSIHGCGPWTWWVLGAIERPDDDWLFAGVMDSHAGAQAGAFSMEEIRRLDKRTWPGVRQVMRDPLLPLELLPIWRGVNPEKPIASWNSPRRRLQTRRKRF